MRIQKEKWIISTIFGEPTFGKTLKFDVEMGKTVVLATFFWIGTMC